MTPIAEEVETLLGYPFEGVEIRRRPSSLLATALCDLAAFAGDPGLYEDIVNHILAAGLVPQYWQASDTLGQFSVEADDVIHYPAGLNHSEIYEPFNEFRYADHVKREPKSFKVSEIVGATGHLALSVLLRDRYFPTLWPLLAANIDPGRAPLEGGRRD